MREKNQLFFGLQLVSKEFQHPAIQTKIEQHFGGFFHKIKVHQPIGRQDSMKTVIQTSRRLDSFFRTFQIFKSEIKIKNLLRLLSFSRPFQWYHWPDATFNIISIFECTQCSSVHYER
jgi:hypothetical protein